MRNEMILAHILFAVCLVSSFCRSHSHALELIQKRFESGKLPIFEFGDMLGKAIDSIPIDNEGKVELLFTTYLDKLRDFYLEDFHAHVHNTDFSRAITFKNFIVKECQAAMDAAIPKNHLKYSRSICWDIEGPLQELIDDIDKSLEGFQDIIAREVY